MPPSDPPLTPDPRGQTVKKLAIQDLTPLQSPPRAMALTPGTRVGAYEIVGALGAGGMGEVYRARDLKLARDVALKTLPASFSTDPQRRGRLHREAQLLAALSHPHIATIYGLEEIDGTSVLAMELVEGESIADRL